MTVIISIKRSCIFDDLLYKFYDNEGNKRKIIL